jgi:FtsP/CotA-like multicopper oxidase with cupredoxin domain
MFNTRCWLALGLLSLCATPAMAQSFRVQCPTNTITHPDLSNKGINSAESAYLGPTVLQSTVSSDPTWNLVDLQYPKTGYLVPQSNANGAIKCQQISGGDGYATMADGHQTFMFSFGPLSGLANIAAGNPDGAFDRGSGAVPPSVFNTVFQGFLLPGDPATTDGASDSGTSYSAGTVGSAASFTYNGAIGITPDADCIAANQQTPAGQALPCPNLPANGLDGHVDPRQIMDVGVMNGNIPAPLITMDEDDEFFLTLTNVGMIMRPDLFEQHTVHFHGYPNASSFYDGVPDASVAINIGGSFTYYYLSPDAGTYFWHCHITPPEHLQMGMVGQLYVRPRQDRVPADGKTTLFAARQTQDSDLRTACVAGNDILCSNPLPAANNGVVRAQTGGAARGNYAYNDGDGSTYYDVEYPIQIHGFDPNFHFVGMTFNPEAFADMKDKYFLLNGRSYPDTATNGPMATQSSDGKAHYSQPLPAVINIPQGQRALLRIADLDVSEYQTLASLGIRMQVVGYNAKLLRDEAGNNTAYVTNSITLGGGESLDAILDTCLLRATVGDPSSSCTTPIPKGTYFLYTPNLDHLSNDAENFGGLMTEVHVL